MKEIIGRSDGIISIEKGKSVRAASAKMLHHKVGCLIVTDDQGEFVGLVTERDIANWVATTEEIPEQTPISEIMTDQVVSCSQGTPSGEAREIMTSHRIRHLPIVEKDTVVGILSVRDLMGQQLLEDRAAAEEVAMLANCLKSIDLNEAAATVTQEAPKLFKAERCVLCLYRDGDTSNPPELVSHNQCPRAQEALSSVIDSGEIGRRDTVCTEDVPADCASCQACGPRLVVHLNVSDIHSGARDACPSLYGYLCMCGLDSATSQNKELLAYKAKLAKEILTSHLTNATLYQHAQLTSLTDALTGIGSRKLLEDKLEYEYNRSHRYKTPFSAAIIDLDNFKSINDVLGHATGDDALRRLATVMEENKRTTDIVARYGGDEFVVLMPETKAEEALVLLERLHKQARTIELSPDSHITISCGLAQNMPDEDESPSDVMRRADLALYDAKSAGRDCVRIWNNSMTQMLKADDIEIGKIKQLQRRVAGLSEKAECMFMQSIWGLVQALEAKNPVARKHSDNVMSFATGIGQGMDLGPKQMDIIRRAAMLHDIGKIGVPDAILAKPDQLSPRERKIIEQHPLIAVRILDKMNFLENEIAIVRHHHEKWNGTGYPDGLSQADIPLGARILAVADTLDALTSTRTYHEPVPLSKALKILIDASGYEFDPDVTKGLLVWVENYSHELCRPVDQMSVQDLLDSVRETEDGEFEEPEILEELIGTGAAS
jgi:diguanylate cyclase (GGDEF)-like protein/putative nucleotidyltransferase with HDIG domain